MGILDQILYSRQLHLPVVDLVQMPLTMVVVEVLVVVALLVLVVTVLVEQETHHPHLHRREIMVVLG
jgi:hypothetical protein